MFIIIAIIYGANKDFRSFMDKYVLGKNVTEENLPTIDIDYNSNIHVIPYGNFICILAENPHAHSRRPPENLASAQHSARKIAVAVKFS